MKIACIRPEIPGRKDDTSQFCDGFARLGHEVVSLWADTAGSTSILRPGWQEAIQAPPPDVVWAPYESLIGPALDLRKRWGVPVVGHYEMAPPFRVDLDHKAHWGFPDALGEEDRRWHDHYRQQALAWRQCDLRTGVDPDNVSRIHRLLGYDTGEWHVKPYPIDVDYFRQWERPVEKKRQIISIFRLQAYKRAHHVIQALGMLANPPAYILVGEGREKVALLQDVAWEGRVDVQFAGPVSDEEKVRLVQESLLGIFPWAWLPVAECALFGVPSVVYDHPSTRFRLGEMPWYVPNNDVARLAARIDAALARTEEIHAQGSVARSILLGGASWTKPADEACRIMVGYFEKVAR